MSLKRHPIQVVARRAGLTPELLRAWEKRYQVVEPGRTGGGQRLYSDEDIQHLRLLRLSIEGGRRIGNVAGLSSEDLMQLLEEDRGAQATMPAEEFPAPAEAASGERSPILLENALGAALSLDEPRLRRLLDRAVILMRPETLISELLAPLMTRVGELWHEGELRPAHEHLLSAVVRNILGRITAATQSADAEFHVVVATPARQLHEIGAMLAAATAATCGWRVTYLGANLPAEDIAAVVRETGAQAVALSIVYPQDDADLPEELRSLKRLVPRDTEILVGGAAAEAYTVALEEVGARRLNEIGALQAILAELSGVGD